MKKPNTQVRKEGSARDAAKQATKTANTLQGQLAALVPGNGKTDDCLWALPDGRLFLWSGYLKETPREVSLQAARDWWIKYQSHSPQLAAPFFPEDSDAAEFTYMVCQAIQKRESAAKQPAGIKPAAAALPVTASAPAGAVLMPSEVALGMADALDCLKLKANAARALALLNTDMMKHDIEANAGWESFNGVQGFEEGNYELARHLGSHMDCRIEDYETVWRQVIEQLRACKSPVALLPVSKETREAILKAQCHAEEFRAGTLLENSVSAVKSLLELQGTVMAMGSRKVNVWNAVKITGDELWTAFEYAFHVARSLQDAVVAVELSRREAQRLAA